MNVRAFATKPGDLSSFPKTHIWMVKINLCRLSSDGHIRAMVGMHSCMCGVNTM